MLSRVATRYVVTELLLGGELFSLAEEEETGYLRPASAKFYASCVLSALAAMHAQHIVYRDLKPENVMMDPAGFAKVSLLARRARSSMRRVQC